MPTIITHPAVALAIAPYFRRAIPQKRWWMIGALLTVVPDFDALGFRAGVAYGSFWGHRGFTHSLLFALLLGVLLLPFADERSLPRRLPLLAYLFLCGASHGLLDALTDGGLGVAFFAPFTDHRYFFAWRPMQVSPIGIRSFFAGSWLGVLRSELVWVVLPSAALGAIGFLVPAFRRRRSH